MTTDDLDCDLAILGGGLSGGLIALAFAAQRPDVRLLLIERGERHEIRATGDAPLKTVNFYSPPAYTATGGERPAGRS